MKNPHIETGYFNFLSQYLENGDPEALAKAYEIGRSILNERTAVLEISEIHHQCLSRRLAGQLSGEEKKLILDRAARFFMEFFSPYELIVESWEEIIENLRQKTKNLEEINFDLEAFSYSIAHDLRAPLRTVCGFTGLILKDHSSELDQKAKDLFSHITEATLQMNSLIDGLLSFCKVSQSSLLVKKINMRLLVTKVTEELSDLNKHRHIRFIIGDIPDSKGDPAMIRHVLYNLLENAIKYTKSREEAVIRIESVRKNTGFIAYEINDNGIGFDNQYREKLFGVFQRLHNSSEYEGTGIGLAIVKRIITKHGGTVWASGTPDKGATFSFTLPG